MTNPRPPLLAEWFAESLVSDRQLREAALGDLAEDFAMIGESDGIGAAGRWYWFQVLRSVLPLSMLSLRSAGAIGWLRLISSIVVGYVVLVVFVVVSDGWLMSVTSHIGLVSVVSLMLSAVGALAAGYVAALIGGKTPMLAALALGALCVSISVMMFVYLDGDGGSPLWYRISLMLMVLPVCAFGAMLRGRSGVTCTDWKHGKK